MSADCVLVCDCVLGVILSQSRQMTFVTVLICVKCTDTYDPAVVCLMLFGYSLSLDSFNFYINTSQFIVDAHNV